jgi:hypothetical protein
MYDIEYIQGGSVNLSYREKSLWGTLAVTLAVYGYYFGHALRGAHPAEFNAASVGHVVAAVFVLVVIEVVYQIVLAVTSKVEPKDERDILIESKAYRNAYLLLAGGTFWLMWTIVAQQMRSYMAVNLMLLCVVAAEITKSLTQLFLYWRGL